MRNLLGSIIGAIVVAIVGLPLFGLLQWAAITFALSMLNSN